jgi:hypothetical protein
MAGRLKWVVVYACAFLVGAAILTFVGDYAVLRIRIATKKNPFGQVTVTPYFAVQLKNGNVEYDFQPPQIQDCANSLYPQMGMQPCWYLENHREQRIDIGTPSRRNSHLLEDFGGAPGERS